MEKMVGTAAMAQPETSPTKNNKGFTLLEVLVVLGIIAAVVALGLPRINKNSNNLKKVVREMGVLGKEIRHRARLMNRTYRLVFEMPPNGTHSYFVEFASGPVLAKSAEQMEKEEKLDEKERPASPFQRDETILKKIRELPAPFVFGQVESADRGELVTEGKAFIYFLPQGLVEQSLIQITDKKDKTWTLIFNPLTGQSDIFERAVDLKELRK
jgi:general secretion pathway protein H